MKELYYSQKQECFSTFEKEDFKKIPDIGTYLNEMFFYYCEPLLMKGSILNYESIHYHLRYFLEFEITEKELYDIIRYRLDSKGLGRFDMIGYEFRKGDCTVHNINILNSFADLGIYDFTKFLFLDFYKGTPYIYYRYWREDETKIIDNISGAKTVEIIKKIFDITIFSGKTERRRLC